MRALPSFLVLMALVGCEEPRGDAGLGEACEGSRDCARGLCVGGVAGDAPACTVSCASSDECPEGWSCSALTAENVLVCRKGSATPFGDGH